MVVACLLSGCGADAAHVIGPSSPSPSTSTTGGSSTGTPSTTTTPTLSTADLDQIDAELQAISQELAQSAPKSSGAG